MWQESILKKFFICWIQYLIFGFLIQAEYITQFGNEVLIKIDAIVQGTQKEWIPIHPGNGIVRFYVEKVYWGKIEVYHEIYLYYQRLSYFSSGERQVVFIKRLHSPSNFQVIGEFSLKDKDSKMKIRTLQKLLALELIPENEKKKNAYLCYCLKGLEDKESWVRAHAFLEWKYLKSRYKELINLSILDRLRKLYFQIPELSIRENIQKTIVQLEQKQKSFSNFAISDDIPYSTILSKIKKAKAVLVKSPSLSYKIQALHFLALFPCKDSYQGLLLALRDSSPHLRALAVFYLGWLKVKSAIPELRKVLKNDPSLRVRKNAIQALQSLESIEAIPEIQMYFHVPYTQQIANQALKTLKTLNKP